MRSVGVCVRHSPQRLHAATASRTRAGSQFNCNSTRFRSAGDGSSAVGGAASRRRCRLRRAGGGDVPRLQRRPQVPRDQIGVVADDLARIEDVLRVEDPLHFAEHVEQRAGLPADERRAAQSAGVFAADAARRRRTPPA